MNASESPLPDRRRPIHLAAGEQRNRAVIYLVTVCTSERQLVLANDNAREVLVAAWRAAAWFSVGRYVVMPDHVHLFCAPATLPAEPLSRWMNYWKSITARRWRGNEGSTFKLWQRDFWDRQLRSGDSYSEKWAYVRNNPVRAGLVRETEEWKWQGELEVLRWHE